MTEFLPNEMVVDEVFFGWSDVAGKMALLDSSFVQLSQKQQWLGRLEPFIRLKSLGDEPLPAEALSYFQFDDGAAAILHRVNKGPSGARNNSHALIGPAVALNELVALGLAVWEKWKWLEELPGGGRLRRFEAGSFADAAEVADAIFREQVRQLERELTVVLARLLDDPSAPLSILGCTDKNRLTLVWGLRAAADDYLRSQLPRARSWSFSTYEHRVNVNDLPGLVFLPARPTGSAPVRRVVVELNRDIQPSGRNAERAIRLVARLLHGTPLPVDERERTTEIPVGATVYDPPFEGRSGPPPVPVAQTPVSNGVHNQPAHRLPTPDPSYDWGEPGPADEDPNVAALLNARNMEDFLLALSKLEKSSRSSAAHREQLRRQLSVSVIDKVARFVQDEAPDNIFDRLTNVLFGPDRADLSRRQGLEFADDLIRRTRTDRLARIVMSAIPEGRLQMGDLAPDLTSPWLKRAAKAVRRNPRPAAIGFSVTVTMLAMMFLFGWLNAAEDTQSSASPPAVGVGGETAQDVATPNPPNSSSPAPVRVPELSFSAPPPPAGQQIFFFAQAGESYYPQGLCMRSGEQADQMWKCVAQYELSDSAGGTVRAVAVQVADSNVDGLNAKAQSREMLTEAQFEKSWKEVAAANP